DERPLRLAAVARLIEATDALWFGTPEEKALLQRVHPSAQRVASAIGNVGVDLTAGDPERFRAHFGLGGPLLLYGGRTARGKGGEAMFAGVDHLRMRWPDARLVVSGGDPAAAPAQEGVVAVGNLD